MLVVPVISFFYVTPVVTVLLAVQLLCAVFGGQPDFDWIWLSGFRDVFLLDFEDEVRRTFRGTMSVITFSKGRICNTWIQNNLFKLVPRKVSFNSNRNPQ